MNTLFLICPTDFLETTINSRFKGRNYFYTSLGVSIQLSDEVTVGQIKNFILDNGIKRIILVLKDSNTFLNGMANQSDVKGIVGIHHLQKDINQSKTEIERYRDNTVKVNLCISNYLNRKVFLLNNELNKNQVYIEIKALIYNETNQVFENVITPLISIPNYSLN